MKSQTHKYRFCCNCGEPSHIYLFPEAVVYERDALNMFSGAFFWTINRNGKLRACSKQAFPRELNYRYFTLKAYEFARDILAGKWDVWCAECGEAYEVTCV